MEEGSQHSGYSPVRSAPALGPSPPLCASGLKHGGWPRSEGPKVPGILICPAPGASAWGRPRGHPPPPHPEHPSRGGGPWVLSLPVSQGTECGRLNMAANLVSVFPLRCRVELPGGPVFRNPPCNAGNTVWIPDPATPAWSGRGSRPSRRTSG